MSRYLFRLGHFAYHRRRRVVVVWLLILVGVGVAAFASGGKTNNNFTIPGTQSQQAVDLLQKKLPAFSGGQTQVVFATMGDAKVTDPADKAGIQQAVANLKGVPQVSVVGDPFQTGTVSPDGYVALGTVQYSVTATAVKTSSLDAVRRAVAPAQDAGVQVEYSGSVYPGSNIPLSEAPEIVGILVALGILLITFGAVVAAGLPILTAILGVGTAVAAVTALAAAVDIASAATSLALMLGLSCGIDYALFILSRHRNHLLLGMAVEDSIPLSVGTAGSSVVFAALTVIVALCGLSVAGIPFLTVMGLAAAGSVLIAALIALTLLPALLGFAGQRVAKFIATPLRPGHNEQVAQLAAHHPDQTAGAAWARFVVRGRVPVLIVAVALLLVIAIPFTRLQLGLPSGASQPTDNTARKAYDLTSRHFGPGFNGPLVVVADLSHAKSPQAVGQIVATLKTQADVVLVAPTAQKNGIAVISVVPKTGPNNTATAHLVSRIRHDRAPILAATGVPILVGGTTASNIDTSAKLSGALPVFILVVVGLAFVLLTFAFRTILVPLKSIIGFLLSVSAAFGAEVAVFQWGWGASLLGVTPSETVSFLPILVLAIVFGLSSDYEVFVVSRIKEEFSKSGEARPAVVKGAGASARVVTAAALIMFGVFVAFLSGPDPIIKGIGFTLAVGVFLDAFVVRLTLVPAVMAIVGSKLWYHSPWFDKYVPDPDIEGRKLQELMAAGGSPHRELAVTPE